MAKDKSCSDEIEINGETYIRKASAAPNTDGIVLVRTYSAGVHVGRMTRHEGTEVVLENATRVWRWRGANTLSELSQRGGDKSYTRVSEPVPSITLTQAVEIIPCSAIGAANLLEPRWPN